MRIRKRRPPPPPPPPPDLQSSTLQPASSSDSPPLHRHSRDLLQTCNSHDQSLRSVTEDEDRRQPDLDLAALSRTKRFDSLDENRNTRSTRPGSNQVPPVGVGEEEDVDEVAAGKNPTAATDRRMVYNHGAETSPGSSISSSPSHQGHWCEEDKVFPLKKRRASFTRKVRERTIMDKEQKESVKGTRNMNQNGLKENCYQSGEGEGEEEGADDEKNGARKRSRENGGKTLMEGSRCSRRNGRGWRCYQPTLPGYSMCEHHLSQARLRGLNSVRRRNGPNTQRKKVDTSLRFEDKDDSGSDDEDEEKGFKKRKRIGIMKARSISSLLGQTLPPPPPPPPAPPVTL